MWAWGANGSGQLGDNTQSVYNFERTPIQIKPETKFAKVSAGGEHSLAIDSSGDLWAWGRNNRGELGDGTEIAKYAPVQIEIGAKIEEISTGHWWNSLVRDSSGDLWSFGNNENGQIGDGTTIDRFTPVQIMIGTLVTKISAEYAYNQTMDTVDNLFQYFINQRSFYYKTGMISFSA